MTGIAMNTSLEVAGNTIRPPHRVFVLGWPAYIQPFFVLLFFGPVAGLIAMLIPIVGIVLLSGVAGLFAYRIMEVYSVKLFTQGDGVWVYFGVFPWNKGVYGVKWRDLNEATYRPGFFGWLTKSYTISITNRFTSDDNEVKLPFVKNGDEAVIHINKLHIHGIREAGDIPAEGHAR